MSVQPKPQMTVAEYLAFELETSQKHEYFKGEIYAMGGASFSHGLLTGNLVSALHARLRGKPCRVAPADLRVKVSPTGLHTYPDVVVVCGEPKLEQPGDTLLNPKLIIEVLSESTERKDRGWKFEQYQTIETLTDYLLVAQDTPRLELFTRQTDGRWLYVAQNRIEASVMMPSIECELRLADVYEKVEGLREPERAYRA